jgi:hypothetical protein
VIPLRSEQRKDGTFTLLVQHSTARLIEKRKEKKKRKEKTSKLEKWWVVKLSQFADEMILHIEKN